MKKLKVSTGVLLTWIRLNAEYVVTLTLIGLLLYEQYDENLYCIDYFGLFPVAPLMDTQAEVKKFLLAYVILF